MEMDKKTVVKSDFLKLVDSIREWLYELIDLEHGTDKENTIIYIKNNKRVRGANAWLLMCSIMIASLGLDLNSPAVIIGAMLISPLMSPILGIGLSVAINDRDALYTSLFHFGVSIIIALVTSTLYFYITPFGEITPEIRARTQPTLLDGLVAVFGGLAGIISVTRKEGSNAIPGVAIATALMPPLCVTGFGIANGRMDIGLPSFYLFFLNSFFIALTAYLIIRLLDFPLKSYEDQKEARRTRAFLLIFSLLVIIPSIIILRNLYQERQEKEKIGQFLEIHFGTGKDTQCWDYDLIKRPGDSTRTMILKLWGKPINKDSLDPFYNTLDSLKLQNIVLDPKQGTDLDAERYNSMEQKLLSLEEHSQKVDILFQKNAKQNVVIQQLQIEKDSLQNQQIRQEQIFLETKKLFPEIKSISYAEVVKTNFDTTGSFKLPTFILDWDNTKISRTNKNKAKQKLEDFLKTRAQLDTIQIINN